MYTVAAWYFREIAEQCIEHGLDRAHVRNISPDYDTVDAQSRIPVDHAVSLLEATAEQSGHEDVALRIGFELRPNSLSDLEHFSAACKTFVEAVTFNRKYPGLRQNLGLLDVVSDSGGKCKVIWETDHDEPERYRRFAEMVMARYCAFGTAILMRLVAEPEDGKTLEVHFRHAAPTYAASYESHWPGARIRFDMPVEATLHPAALHKTQLGIYSPMILDVLRKKLDEHMSLFTHSIDTTAVVRAAIRAQMKSGHVSIATISDALDRKPSSIRRELREVDTSFRQLVESERKRACVKLIENQTALAEVAYQLGYNDQPSFNRAFKRWFSVTPSRWMKQTA